MSSAYGIIATESESVILIILPSASDGHLFSAVHEIWHGGSIPELRDIEREGLADITSWLPVMRKGDRKSGGSSGGSTGGRSGCICTYSGCSVTTTSSGSQSAGLSCSNHKDCS